MVVESGFKPRRQFFSHKTSMLPTEFSVSRLQDLEVYLHVIIWAAALQTKLFCLTSSQGLGKPVHLPSLFKES